MDMTFVGLALFVVLCVVVLIAYRHDRRAYRRGRPVSRGAYVRDAGPVAGGAHASLDDDRSGDHSGWGWGDWGGGSDGGGWGGWGGGGSDGGGSN